MWICPQHTSTRLWIVANPQNTKIKLIWKGFPFSKVFKNRCSIIFRYFHILLQQLHFKSFFIYDSHCNVSSIWASNFSQDASDKIVFQAIRFFLWFTQVFCIYLKCMHAWSWLKKAKCSWFFFFMLYSYFPQFAKRKHCFKLQSL